MPAAAPALDSASTLVASPMSHPVWRAWRAASWARQSDRAAGDDLNLIVIPRTHVAVAPRAAVRLFPEQAADRHAT